MTKLTSLWKYSKVDVNTWVLKTKLRVSTKPALRPPHRSPDLVVFRYFIDLNIICPNLACFENLVLFVWNWESQFQGLAISMHDVTDKFMRLQIPPNNLEPMRSIFQLPWPMTTAVPKIVIQYKATCSCYGLVPRWHRLTKFGHWDLDHYQIWELTSIFSKRA